MLNNIPQVTKNILILNIIMFFATLFFENQGVDLNSLLGAHYINSPLFQPFQIVTHFFMHGGFMHIFFNMWLLVMLGGYLERLWGPKRFFIFYIASAIGAFALYNAMGVYEIMQLKNKLISQGVSWVDFEYHIKNNLVETELYSNMDAYKQLYIKCVTPMVGASGGVFGIMAAFAILFPNTEFLIYFTFPIKAKFLVGGYFLLELYLSFQDIQGDNVAHLAHVGGAIVGGIIVLFWRKTDRQNFY
ncbi:MAG: hypothetical protein RL264_51 [Bacteroidota bacterium]|jgi:rhomboid-like protein